MTMFLLHSCDKSELHLIDMNFEHDTLPLIIYVTTQFSQALLGNLCCLTIKKKCEPLLYFKWGMNRCHFFTCLIKLEHGHLKASIDP